MSIEFDPQVQAERTFHTIPSHEGPVHPQALQKVDSQQLLLPPPVPHAPQEAHAEYMKHMKSVDTERRLAGAEPVQGRDNNNYDLDRPAPKHGNGLKALLAEMTGFYGTPEGQNELDRRQMVHTQTSVYKNKRGELAQKQGLPSWSREKVSKERRARIEDTPTIDPIEAVAPRHKEHVAWEREIKDASGDHDERLAEFSRQLDGPRWRPRHAVRGLTRAIRHRKGAK